MEALPFLIPPSSPPLLGRFFWPGSRGGNATFEKYRAAALGCGRQVCAAPGSLCGLQPGERTSSLLAGPAATSTLWILLALYTNRGGLRLGGWGSSLPLPEGILLQAGDALLLDWGCYPNLWLLAEVGGDGLEWIVPRLGLRTIR